MISARILALSLLAAPSLPAQSIISITVSSGSQDGGTLLAGTLTASAPLSLTSGPGWLLNPTINFSSSPNLGLHTHSFSSAHIPTDVVVTFQFDQPVVVRQLLVYQQTNGMTRVEGFVGNSLSSLTSVGNIFGPRGDATGAGVFSDGESNVFDFVNSTSGTYFRFVATKASLENGLAVYRSIPQNSAGSSFAISAIPEPSQVGLLFGVVAFVGSVAHRRRRANKAPEPTPGPVTDRAGARPAPVPVVAHL